jgi:hypothetical protein
MGTDEAVRARAREVCEHSFLHGGPPIIEAVAAALQAAVAEEREECAKLAESWTLAASMSKATRIAAAIRARSNPHD